VYLKQRAGLIDPDHAQDFGAGNPVLADTVLVTAADVSGQMISFIQSNSYGFGSGCVEPTYGISLQNRGHAFRVKMLCLVNVHFTQSFLRLFLKTVNL
jgi:gamma-glutamyltranspeptidase / glutathione hydrolase